MLNMYDMRGTEGAPHVQKMHRGPCADIKEGAQL